MPPVVYLLCGLTGSGKTTYARQLEAAGAVRLSVDEEVFARHGRYGVDYPTSRVLRPRTAGGRGAPASPRRADRVGPRRRPGPRPVAAQRPRRLQAADRGPRRHLAAAAFQGRPRPAPPTPRRPQPPRRRERHAAHAVGPRGLHHTVRGAHRRGRGAGPALAAPTRGGLSGVEVGAGTGRRWSR